MFHIFTYYILGCNVSRETLSSIIFFSFYTMFHVKHCMELTLYLVKTFKKKDIYVTCFTILSMLG